MNTVELPISGMDEFRFGTSKHALILKANIKTNLGRISAQISTLGQSNLCCLVYKMFLDKICSWYICWLLERPIYSRDGRGRARMKMGHQWNLQSVLPRCAPRVLWISRGGAGWGGASIPDIFLLYFDEMGKVLIEAAQADNRKQGRFHAPPPPIEDPQLGLTFLHLRISIPSNSIQREIFSGNHRSFLWKVLLFLGFFVLINHWTFSRKVDNWPKLIMSYRDKFSENFHRVGEGNGVILCCKFSFILSLYLTMKSKRQHTCPQKFATKTTEINLFWRAQPSLRWWRERQKVVIKLISVKNGQLAKPLLASIWTIITKFCILHLNLFVNVDVLVEFIRWRWHCCSWLNTHWSDFHIDERFPLGWAWDFSFPCPCRPLTKLVDDHHRIRQVADNTLCHPRREPLLQCPALLVHHSGDIRVPEEVFFFVNLRRPWSTFSDCA